VVTRRRAKVRVNGLSDELQDPFDKLACSHFHFPLDETHKAVIDELARTGFSSVWIQDHHLLQTHTCALQQLMDDHKQELGLKGFFCTSSRGTDPATPNCFMFPLRNGAWKVYRFGQGITEDPTWTQDGEGWTTCYFNRDPDLRTAARALGGAELADNRGYQFDSAKQASEAAREFGEDVELEPSFLNREAVLRSQKDGRLVMRLARMDGESRPEGWAKVRGGWWERVFDATEPEGDKSRSEYDHIVRVVVTPKKHEEAGVYVRSIDGTWDRNPITNAQRVLRSECGFTKDEAEIILGSAIYRRFVRVCLPFQPEEPGGRQWNLNAPQLKYTPARLRDHEVPYHPHWDMVLDNIGRDLTPYIRKHKWCKEHGILTGADYIKYWIACVLRRPFDKLPYLGFFGGEDAGKSILHEAIGLLVTCGVVNAKRALTNQEGFNGQLENAIVAFVEEIDLGSNRRARNRMKEWTTSINLDIRRMRTDQYEVPNLTHWIQCANSIAYFPVWPGDSRMTLVRVTKPQVPIAKRELLPKLEMEAPHFLASIMDLTLPKPYGRLILPVIHTDHKKGQANESCPLNIFVAECCKLRLDAKSGRTVLRDAYNEWARKHGYGQLNHVEFWQELSDITGGKVQRKGKVKIQDDVGQVREVDAYKGIELKR
jgi:hypothetical protein